MINPYQKELELLSDNNCLRKIPDISTKDGKFVVLNQNKYINLSSNDYLGLSTNQELIKVFLDDNSKNPEMLFSSTSARLLTGTSNVYNLLEKNIAKLFNKEACLLYNTGYQCNLGVISALFNKKDVIFCDKLNHASIIAGMKDSEAAFYRYKHLNYEHLETLLQKHRADYEKAVIITESVFSMDGDVADIQKLIELKKKYNTLIMVDEAHAFGIFGENLCGVSEQKNLLDEVDILTATFGKALSSMGAFCVANEHIIQYLINKSRPFIFSTALPPINVMWTNWLIEKNFGLLKQKSETLKNLFAKVLCYLKENGISSISHSQIIPLVFGDNEKTLEIARYLQKNGFFVLPIRPPTVPPNTSRIRLSLTANIEFNDIKKLLDIAIAELL